MPIDLISTRRAADILGCSHITIHRMVADGRLKPSLIAPGGAHGAFMFDREDIEQLVKDKQPAA